MAEWSEQWTLGAVSVNGPSIYGDQTVEVVPKQEAEQKIEEAKRELDEFEDRFQRCDNCERLTLEDDLKTVWCNEDGEQVDARICLTCRLKADLDQAQEADKERVREVTEADERRYLHEKLRRRAEEARDQALKQGAAEERERLLSGLSALDFEWLIGWVERQIDGLSKVEAEVLGPPRVRLRNWLKTLLAAIDQVDSSE